MKLFEKLNNVRKNKKGFTLVELVVVIIILAILAAILIPSFLGYMNKAQNSQKHVQARSVYLAASTVATEKKYEIAKLPPSLTAEQVKNGVYGGSETKYDDLIKEIQALVGTEITDDSFDYTITFHTTPSGGGDPTLDIKVTYNLVKGTAVIPADPSK